MLRHLVAAYRLGTDVVDPGRCGQGRRDRRPCVVGMHARAPSLAGSPMPIARPALACASRHRVVASSPMNWPNRKITPPARRPRSRLHCSRRPPTARPLGSPRAGSARSRSRRRHRHTATRRSPARTGVRRQCLAACTTILRSFDPKPVVDLPCAASQSRQADGMLVARLQTASNPSSARVIASRSNSWTIDDLGLRPLRPGRPFGVARQSGDLVAVCAQAAIADCPRTPVAPVTKTFTNHLLAERRWRPSSPR